VNPQLPESAGTASIVAAPPADAFPPLLPVAPPDASGGPGIVPAVEAAPPLEDVLSRVMPAVVLIEASGGRGSAFFVGPDTLLTNLHVVGRSSSVTVRRTVGEPIPARVAATASQFDLAVLRLSSAERVASTLPLGSAREARVGQEVVAIGSALGLLQNTVTRGIVSALRQTGDALLLQTDAAVNPGNSGGPLLDRNGRVLGVTTMGFSGRQGLNFAVAIDHARALLDGRPAGPPPATAATHTEIQGLSPSVLSETDQTRLDGTRTYEQALAQLARRADSMDNAWRQFRVSCYQGGVAGGFDREWFAVLDPRGLLGPVPTGCSGWLDDFRRQVREVRAGVESADEAARRAGVYPGLRRDTRRKHRLDYPGLDR
jgi:putative serine protease PepD